MSRKTTFVMICGLAAIVVASVSAAPAGADPMAAQCKDAKSGLPLQDGVERFHVTTDPATANQPSDVYMGMVFCGSDFSLGKSDGFSKITITMPPGVQIRCANPSHPAACTTEPDLSPQRYVGRLPALIMPLGYTNSSTMKDARLYVDRAIPSYLNESVANTNCTDLAIACYQALVKGFATVNVIATKWIDGLGRDRYRLQINKMKPLKAFFGSIYYLQIGNSYPDSIDDMHLCRYAGDTGGLECKWNKDDWVQKNGRAGSYTCAINVLGKPGSKTPGYGVIPSPQPKLDLAKKLVVQGHFCYPIAWT